MMNPSRHNRDEENMTSMHERMGRCARTWRGVHGIICLFALLAATSTAWAAPAVQKSYASPEAAIAALVDAVKSNNEVKLSLILGSQGSKLISSGDAVADERGRAAFVKAYGEANKLVFE